MALISGQVYFGTPVFGVTEPSLSINLSTLDALNVKPGDFGSVSQSVNVTTNNYTGYTAVLTNSTNSTDLINTNDSALVIPTITLPANTNSITSNDFTSGYGISVDGTNYFPAPTSSNNISIGANNASGTNTHTLTFGAKPETSTVAGVYSRTFVVVAVVNNPQYAITYNANAGTDTVTGMPSNVPTQPTTTSTITLSNNTPARDGYTFLGWDTNATATTPTYPAGSTNTMTIEPTQSNEVTLYAIWRDNGTVQITGVSYVSGTNVEGTPNPSVDNDGNVDFDLTFLGGQDNTTTLQAIYRITVSNTSHSDYIFTPPTSNMKLRISANEVRDISYELSGIAAGDTIPALSSVSFNIILNADYVSGEHSAEGGIEVEAVNQTLPSLIGSIYGSNTGDLSGSNTLTSFQIEVESTFEESKTFTINSLSSDFEIVDSSGNTLGSQTIAAGATNTYTFYMKKTNGAVFASETTTAGITINYDSTYTNVGEVKITVDRDQSYVDNQAPTISGVAITKNKTTVGEATLTWSGTDNVGVASYGIYKCANSSCGNMIPVGGTTNSYTFTGMIDGTYYFVVVGFDDEGNTATQTQIDGANQNPGPASSSPETELRWSYNVTSRITDGSISHTYGTSINAGGTYQGVITPNSGQWGTTYSLPNTITVKMDGQTLSASQYEYLSSGTNRGRVTIDNVSGDIEITATMESSCLVEGTIVALADGTTKPIEEITYKDKLKVWDYGTGSIGSEYPAWIEKARTTMFYQLTKLSDGTELKTFGWHGVFDVDSNEFISVDDPSRFYPGTNIYKIENNQLVPVTVVSIEVVEEEVNVYHVVSSQYYNIIANNVLTTDGTVMLSNLYGFDENIKWPELRNHIISDPDNLYTYADFEDIGMPERMFNELRVAEAKYLSVKYGITLEQFKQYLLANQLNPNMWLPYDDE